MTVRAFARIGKAYAIHRARNAIDRALNHILASSSLRSDVAILLRLQRSGCADKPNQKSCSRKDAAHVPSRYAPQVSSSLASLVTLIAVLSFIMVETQEKKGRLYEYRPLEAKDEIRLLRLER